MPVYVDKMQTQFRGMKMCHLLADSLNELHDMADQLGLRPDWFQGYPVAHYDISLDKRRRALRLGATEIGIRATAMLMRRLKEHNAAPSHAENNPKATT